MIDFTKIPLFAADPGRIVAVSDEGVLTYAEFYENLEKLRRYWTEKYKNNAPILFIGDKENLFLSGIFSALTSGHPYIAVSAVFPAARVRDIAEICKPAAVVNFSDQDYEHVYPEWYDKSDIVELLQHPMEFFPDAPLYDWKPDDIIAGFFTSGSTGLPKGVKIAYKNLDAAVMKRHYMTANYAKFEKDEPIVLINFSSYGFIASVTMLLYDICFYGARLNAVDRKMLGDYQRLINFIIDVNPTQVTFTPSFLSICLKSELFCRKNMSRLKVVFLGGSEVHKSIAVDFQKKFPDVPLFNMYGATETTSLTLHYKYDPADDISGAILPSGTCLPYTEAYVADENGNEVPDGTLGELRVISQSVSQGYYNGSEKAFFTTEDGRRGFCSGDLFRKENGLFYYEGRIDSLVKLGGYRVELFDVERNLSLLPEVKSCAVCPAKKNGEIRILTAFVVLGAGIEKGLKTTVSIKKQLREKLQAYAVPQKIVYLDSLPLNNNNKVDRVYLSREADKLLAQKDD